MRAYVLLFVAYMITLSCQAQSKETNRTFRTDTSYAALKAASADRVAKAKYLIGMNSQEITIVEVLTEKTYTFPVGDTLHYDMMRRIKADADKNRKTTQKD